MPEASTEPQESVDLHRIGMRSGEGKLAMPNGPGRWRVIYNPYGEPRSYLMLVWLRDGVLWCSEINPCVEHLGPDRKPIELPVVAVGEWEAVNAASHTKD